MIKAVIFDFDDTLSDRKLNVFNLYYDYFKNVYPQLDEMEFESLVQDLMIYDCFGTTNLSERCYLLKNHYKLPENFFEKFDDYYFDALPKFTVLHDDTIEVLEKLKDKYKLGIITNGDSVVQHNKIKNVNIEKYFDEIIVSGDVGINKPDPAIFKIMADRLGLMPEECMFVGDIFSSDIIGAIKAKMVPCWYISDDGKPSKYTGFRINKLSKLLNILNIE